MRGFIQKTLLVIIACFFFLIYPQNPVNAAPCSFTANPLQTEPHTGSFGLTITGPDTNYKIELVRPDGNPGGSTDLDVTNRAGTITIYIADFDRVSDLGEGAYFTLRIFPSDHSGPACSSPDNTIHLGNNTRTETCTVTSEDTTDGQKFTVTGIGFRPGIPHTIYFGNYTTTKNLDSDGTKEITVPTNDFPIPIPAGNYSVSIHDTDGAPITCGTATLTNNSTSDSGGAGAPGRNPCETTDAYGQICQTAFGPISTNPTAFAARIIEIAIGIAGGIALILLVFGSIRVLTSSGNQQTLSAGRDTIIAAVAGLLFLIFSVIILRSIGLLVGIDF